MYPSIKKILFSATAMIFLLSACLPAARATQSPADIEQQVQTAVALTIAAQNAQTQAAQPIIPEATNTMLPTQTLEVVPTLTPIIIPTLTPKPASSSGSGSGGGSVLSTGWSCDSIRRRPLDNTVFRPDKPFDIKWTIVNTGKKTMRAGLDLKFNSGTLMANTDRVELPEMKPGDQYVVNFDAVSPHKEGTYVMTFVVEGGLCYPYTVIVVQK